MLLRFSFTEHLTDIHTKTVQLIRVGTMVKSDILWQFTKSGTIPDNYIQDKISFLVLFGNK